MTLAFGLLVLESVLLAATVILLVYSIREGRRRDALLREVFPVKGVGLVAVVQPEVVIRQPGDQG